MLIYLVLLFCLSCAPADMEMIRSNEEQIREQFSGVVISVQEAFESEKVSVPRVRLFLLNFFDQNECFHSVKTFDDIFSAASINRLWDYQNYGPLEKLTEYFLPKKEEVASLLNDYTASLTGFLSVTNILQYIKNKELQGDNGDTFAEKLSKLTPMQYKKIKVVLELEERVTELSLIYVHKLWCRIARRYDLPSFTAVIDKITTGSLEVTWLVPQHIIDRIIPNSRFFRTQHIVQVFIDDVIVYDEKLMVGLLCQLQQLRNIDK